jgi:hypothetical protein
VRYTQETIKDGIKVRSLRVLNAGDVVLYGAQRQRNKSRTRIGLLVWVNADDARKVANCLARAGKNGILAAELARRSPVVRQGLIAYRKAHGGGGGAGDGEIEDVLRGSTFVTQAAMTQNDGINLKKSNNTTTTTTTVVPQPAKTQPSVLSIQGSKALWALKCRIEAGLEITEDDLRLAREEVRARSDEADLALDCFNGDLNHVYKLHRRAKNIFGEWKQVLYEALIRAKYGPQPLSSGAKAAGKSWESLARKRRVTHLHPKTGRKASVRQYSDDDDGEEEGDNARDDCDGMSDARAQFEMLEGGGPGGKGKEGVVSLTK